MKIISVLILILVASCATGRSNIYTGSTPGGPEVKQFLGIDINDSIDFVRWQLVLDNRSFTLLCEYGIARPNTTGFMNGGNRRELRGKFHKSGNIYELIQNNKRLKLLLVNQDLLHLLDGNKNMLK